MNIKKIVSAVTAFALSATMFAGFSIQANAATTNEVLNATFETDSTYASGLDFTNTARFASSVTDGTGANTSKVQYMTGSGSSKGYGVYCPVTANADKSIIEYDFDIKLSGRVTIISLGSGGLRDILTTNRAVSFAYHTNDGNAYIITGAGAADITSGGEVFGKSNTWYHVEAKLNNISKTANVKIYDYLASGDYTEATPIYSATDKEYMNSSCNATGFDFYAPNTEGSYIDNMVIRQKVLSMPTISFNKTEGTLNPQGTDKITVTTGKGTDTDTLSAVTVKSSDENVATVAINENENEITVTAVAEGEATVTATVSNASDNADAAETATATYNVKVVAAGKTEQPVTVNYYLTGTTEAVPDKEAASISGKYADDVVEETEVDLATTFDDTSKYVYNREASTKLPYTVLEGENTINLYFDKIDKVASYKVKYTGITKADDTVTLTDAYVGDAYSYVPTKYITDDNGKWAVADDIKLYDGTLSADTSIDIAYTTIEDNIVHFVEGESLPNQAWTYSDNAKSGGKVGYMSRGTYSITLPAGKYKAHVEISAKSNRGQVFSDKDGKMLVGVLETGDYEFNLYEEQTITFGHSKDFGSGGSTTATDGIDYISIVKTGEIPSIAVATTAPSTITVVPTTGTVSAQPVDATGNLGTAEEVDLTDVTTLYIKVTNPTAAAVPTVTLSDNTVITPKKATASTVGTDTYYVYQFVGVDAAEITGATVSYDIVENVAIQ